MRFIKFCLFVLGFAAWSASAVVISLDDPSFLTQLANEQRRDGCIQLYMKYLSDPQIQLTAVKKERLADAFCSNYNNYNNFLSNTRGASLRRSDGYEPLMLVLHDASYADIRATILGVRITFFAEEFRNSRLRRYNINAETEPAQILPTYKHMVVVDLDKWIAERESESTGQLLKWLHNILENPGTNNAVIAIAKYHPEYYKDAHPEVAEFLETFEPVYFGLHKELCERDLLPAPPAQKQSNPPPY